MAPQHALIQRFLQEGAQITQTQNGVIITPASSIPHPELAGQKMHTNTKIFVPLNVSGAHLVNPNAGAPPYSGYNTETPASLACIYMLVPTSNGCDPNRVTQHVIGGSNAVAIVDAYDAPNARSDLAAYSTQFGLPAINNRNFVVWYCGSTVASCNRTTAPSFNSGWAQEITLDIEMVHAMAPGAKIFLVEAQSNSNA